MTGDWSRQPPRDRLSALADGGVVDELDADTPSAYLARYDIAPQRDDGVVCARIRIAGRPALAAAQDPRFLGGSVGASHGAKLGALFRRARAERLPVLLLAASGGVRLHEANAAELALARALRDLLDARAADVPVFAVGTGDVFGGMSVLVCACQRLALVPRARLGLSGPKVIETARGASEVATADAAAIDALFGAGARAAAGAAELLADEGEVVRAWFERAAREPSSLARWVADTQARLGARLGTATATPAMTRDRDRLRISPIGGAMDAEVTHAIDAMLLALPAAIGTIVIDEDSTGHDVSRRAEELLLSHYLAQHAAVLALLRAQGVSLVGLLSGVGHSAAFFANALQADRVFALPDARVVAMEPAAIARVTRLTPAMLAASIDDDPLLGQPVRNFVALGGATLVRDASAVA